MYSIRNRDYDHLILISIIIIIIAIHCPSLIQIQAISKTTHCTDATDKYSRKLQTLWSFEHSNQRSARILDPGNSRRESASFFLARPREMIFWSLDLVSKHESNKMESRSRLEIREWSYDNLDLVSPGESKKNNSQSRLEKLHLLSRVRVRF